MKKGLMTIFSAVLMAASLVLSPAAFAANDFTKQGCELKDISEAQKEALGCNQDQTAPNAVVIILQGVISVVGVLAVVMIVVAGQRYMTANGDAAKLAQAKNMLLYSIVGLLIALLAFAIVSFISGGIMGAGSGE